MRVVTAFAVLVGLAASPVRAEPLYEKYAKFVSDDAASAFIRQALAKIGNVACAINKPCEPASAEERANPPISIEDGRAAMTYGILSALAQWCSLDAKRAFVPMIAMGKDKKKMSDRQLQLMSLIHGDFQARQLIFYAKSGQCPAHLRDQLDAGLPKLGSAPQQKSEHDDQIGRISQALSSPAAIQFMLDHCETMGGKPGCAARKNKTPAAAGAAPLQAQPGGQAEPTLQSVLALAKDAAEAKEPKLRAGSRFNVAQVMRRSGQESAFGSYAADAFAAFAANRAQGDPIPAFGKIEADARRAFAANDFAGAAEMLRGAEDLRASARKCPDPWGEPCWGPIFLNWELEAGDFDAATKRVNSGNWKDLAQRYRMAQRVARAYLVAGRKSEAAGMFLALRSHPDLPSAGLFLVLSLGRTLERLGLVDDAKPLVRQLSADCLTAAANTSPAPMPVEVAHLQLDMGDKDGAIATLRGALELGRPQMYLVYELARAGLDNEAAALPKSPNVDELVILAEIAAGQADRGAFDLALETLERMRDKKADAVAPNTDPARNGGYFLFSHTVTLVRFPITFRGPASHMEPKSAAALGIALAAAHRGDWSVLSRADAIGRQVDPRWGNYLVSGEDGNRQREGLFKALAESSHVKRALEIAESDRNSGSRVEVLLSIAEGLAHLPDRSEYDAWP